MRFRFLFAALPIIAAACGGGDSTAPVVTTIESATFAPALGVNLAASTKTADGLYYRDITVGTGATLAVNQTVGMYYTGSFTNGATFDSKTSGATFSFKLGTGAVIKGWDEGLVGMKVGGRRQLIIPPSLGYGPNDYFTIPGNSILVFTVDAVSAQ
jgi:peptidylprolyl isomerase